MQQRAKLTVVRIVLLCAVLFSTLALGTSEVDDEEYPEAQEVDRVLAADPPPTGVLFNVMEYDEDALEWLIPRIEHYVDTLRRRDPKFPVVVVSHGDEIFSLRDQDRWLYKDVHRRVQRLSEELDVIFHVCGAFARANGIDESEFPQYVDVVPLATTQIKDYRELGYSVISTELSW